MTVMMQEQEQHFRAVPILREAGISAKVIRMDPYKDPDEFIKNLGAEEYEKGFRRQEMALCSAWRCWRNGI